MPTGTLLQTHLLQDKPNRGKHMSQKQIDEYDRVQRLIEEIVVDLTNGVMRSEIFNKFRDRLYENLSEKNIGERQIQNYIKAAWEILKEDRVEKIQELRDLLFTQYMSQYNEATMNGNVLAAKSCLDSIAKIFLPDEKTLNLNAKVEGDITIDFNLIEDEG
jgi:hypothetical protein